MTGTLRCISEVVDLLPPSVHRPIQELIASGLCHRKKLTEDQVEALQDQGTDSIQLMTEGLLKALVI